MKKFVLAVAVAVSLFALAVPASAGEISEAAFLTTLSQQTEAPPAPTDRKIILMPTACDAVNGSACSSAGATTTCRDVCGYQVNCVCTTYIGNLKYWRCGWQC